MGLRQFRHRTGSRSGLRDVTRTYDNGSFGILLHFIRICHTSRCSSLTATISWSLDMTVLTVCSIDLIIGYHLYDNGSSRSKIIKVFILILLVRRALIYLFHKKLIRKRNGFIVTLNEVDDLRDCGNYSLIDDH